MIKLKQITTHIETALLFLISISFGSIFSTFVIHRQANQYNISNASNLGFESNYLRVLVFIIAGLVVFALLLKLQKRNDKILRYVVALMVAAVISTNVLLSIPSQKIDMFHYGEQLGPALEFKEGKSLYSDLFFLHGAGEDIVMPNIAFSIFNNGTPSIGSYLLIFKIIQSITVIILFLLMAFLFRSQLAFLASAIWIYGSIYIYSSLGSGKYIFLYLLIFLYYIYLNRVTGKKRCWLLASIGLISSLSLLYSIEVGVLLLAIAAGLAILHPLLDKKGSSHNISIPNIKDVRRFVPTLSILAGIIVGQITILIILGAGNYAKFIKTTFVDIPAFQGQLFSYSDPVMDSSLYNFGFWLPIILAPIVIFIAISLTARQIKKQRGINNRLLFILLLLGSSILGFRFGVNRPDFFHIATVSTPFFLASFLIIEEYFSQKNYINDKLLWGPVLFIMLLAWPQATWNISNIFITQESSRQSLSDISYSIHKKDSLWLTDEQKNVVDYIDKNSSDKDGLFVFTAEPLYYYLTNRHNPSRFFLTWFADPQPYTDELLKSLKQSPPKFIIYSGPTQYDNIDGVRIQDRVPEVDSWIKSNYPIQTNIGQTLILSQK